MKAVVFEEHGGPDVLQYTDIPEPEPKPFEVLIEVKAAGANFNDIWARRGMPGMKVIFPHVAGSDVSGVVRAVGSDVSGTGFGSATVGWATRWSSIPASPAARARCARRARSSSAASS
jgi:alcohol dehydrogenase